MIVTAIVVVVAAAAGFGVGRIKNSAKLAAIRAEIAKVEGVVEADFKVVVAKVKSLL